MKYLLLFILLFVVSRAQAADAFSIIERDGLLEVADAWYIYSFYKDGTFVRANLGNNHTSFAFVQGTWMRYGADFVTEGLVVHSGYEDQAVLVVEIKINVSSLPDMFPYPQKKRVGWLQQEVSDIPLYVMLFAQRTVTDGDLVASCLCASFSAHVMPVPPLYFTRF